MSISGPQSGGLGTSAGLHIYVYGTLSLYSCPGAQRVLTGSSPSVLTRNLLTKSPRPCQVIISTSG